MTDKDLTNLSDFNINNSSISLSKSSPRNSLSIDINLNKSFSHLSKELTFLILKYLPIYDIYKLSLLNNYFRLLILSNKLLYQEISFLEDTNRISLKFLKCLCKTQKSFIQTLDLTNIFWLPPSFIIPIITNLKHLNSLKFDSDCHFTILNCIEIFEKLKKLLEFKISVNDIDYNDSLPILGLTEKSQISQLNWLDISFGSSYNCKLIGQSLQKCFKLVKYLKLDFLIPFNMSLDQRDHIVEFLSHFNSLDQVILPQFIDMDFLPSTSLLLSCSIKKIILENYHFDYKLSNYKNLTCLKFHDCVFTTTYIFDNIVKLLKNIETFQVLTTLNEIKKPDTLLKLQRINPGNLRLHHIQEILLNWKNLNELSLSGICHINLSELWNWILLNFKNNLKKFKKLELTWFLADQSFEVEPLEFMELDINPNINYPYNNLRDLKISIDQFLTINDIIEEINLKNLTNLHLYQGSFDLKKKFQDDHLNLLLKFCENLRKLYLLIDLTDLTESGKELFQYFHQLETLKLSKLTDLHGLKLPFYKLKNLSLFNIKRSAFALDPLPNLLKDLINLQSFEFYQDFFITNPNFIKSFSQKPFLKSLTLLGKDFTINIEDVDLLKSYVESSLVTFTLSSGNTLTFNRNLKQHIKKYWKGLKKFQSIKIEDLYSNPNSFILNDYLNLIII